jgi:hypothetical protein
MASANPTTNYIYRQGTTGQTSAVISSRFKIYSPAVGVGAGTKLGVTSAFSISESKNIEAIRGLGYGDQIAELVPGVTSPMSLNVTRTALYLANLMQMMGYKAGVSGAVRSLRHHKWPFDIRTELVFSELASEDPNQGPGPTPSSDPKEGGLNNYGNPGLYAIMTQYEGCWFENYSTAYQAEQAAVTEEATIIVRDVFDISGSVYGEFVDSGNNSGDVTKRSLMFAQTVINQ